jgi:hypothetical protein
MDAEVEKTLGDGTSEWCRRFAACRLLGYLALNRDPHFLRVKNQMDRAQEVFRRDRPQSSSSAYT